MGYLAFYKMSSQLKGSPLRSKLMALWIERLPALRHRNYRLFFSGQMISLMGTWIQRLTMGWLAYRLTRSSISLGLIGFTSQIPTFLLTPIAGVLADRLDRRRVIIITQTLAMVQALSIAILVITGKINFPWLVAMSLFLGIVNAFDTPLRHSFIVDLLEDREDLGNAIAINSMMINITRMIGPSVAGIMITLVGEGICFLLNALSYVAVIWALFLMKVKVVEKRLEHQLFVELQDGFQYAFSAPMIRSILLLLGLVSFAGMSYTTLIPIYVREILHGSANTQGYLMGSIGLGSLLSALLVASCKTVSRLRTYIPMATGLVGVGLVFFSMIKEQWLALMILFVIGMGTLAQTVISNTIIQTDVAEEKRGRVMSIYTVAFLGMEPFGNLFMGSLAHRLSLSKAFLIGGSICVVGAFLFMSGNLGERNH
jgi:MFS family permease